MHITDSFTPAMPCYNKHNWLTYRCSLDVYLGKGAHFP